MWNYSVRYNFGFRFSFILKLVPSSKSLEYCFISTLKSSILMKILLHRLFMQFSGYLLTPVSITKIDSIWSHNHFNIIRFVYVQKLRIMNTFITVFLRAQFFVTLLSVVFGFQSHGNIRCKYEYRSHSLVMVDLTLKCSSNKKINIYAQSAICEHF